MTLADTPLKQSKPKEIRALTGIRGAAACYVMAYHFFSNASIGPAGTFIGHGYLAVDLFFVLSGFVMALTYAEDFRKGFAVQAYARFMVKRLGRIYPLYISATIAAFLIAVSHHEPHLTSATRWACNILLIQAWGLSQSIAHAVWSISTEFGAYVLFPGLLAVTLLCRPRVAAFTALAAAATFLLLATRPLGQLHQATRSGMLDIWGGNSIFPLLRCLAGFSLGASCLQG